MVSLRGCHWVGAGSPGSGLWCVPSRGTQGGEGTLIRALSPPAPHPEMPGHSGNHVLPNTVLGGFHTGPPPGEQSRGGRGILWSLIRKMRLCRDLSTPGCCGGAGAPQARGERARPLVLSPSRHWWSLGGGPGHATVRGAPACVLPTGA